MNATLPCLLSTPTRCCRKARPVAALALALLILGAPFSSVAAESSSESIDRIKEEGLHHSQVMDILSYLTDVIGPRLTGSPGLRRANEWTRDRLSSWGLTNAHLEAWGPFGRGWTLKRFSAQLVGPETIPLIGAPRAWSPGLDHPLTAEVVYLDTLTNSNLQRYRGKLKGAIVLVRPPREVRPQFEPMAVRLSDSNLLMLANAGQSSAPMFGMPSVPVSRSSGGLLGALTGRGGTAANPLSFAAQEEAALLVTPSAQGEGGTLFVEQAFVFPRAGSAYATGRVWATNAPAIPPQITLAAEDYNRLVRIAQQGEKLRMSVDFEVQFNDEDPMAYNTVAEIPGTDLKDEIVMLGGHLDSWHAGTGATDNAVGCAAALEAVRLIKALDLHPRRTIRVALWSGEEQGLFGSAAYVRQHFGYYTNVPRTATTSLRAPKDEVFPAMAATRSASSGAASVRTFVRLAEYDKFSAYFNVDNGAGKIRGIYLQGNEAARPVLRRWLEPLRDLGAGTVSLSNTSGTDHQSFDAIGLPGFQFIQDPLDYWTRTHHSNEDVFDRVPPDDLKQIAVIFAAFAYDAAMADEKVPRKPAN